MIRNSRFKHNGIGRAFKQMFLQMLYWLLLFAGFRAFFLIYYFGLVKFEKPGIAHVLYSFIAGLHLDFATTAYFLMIPFVLILFALLLGQRFLRGALTAYTFLITFLYILISAGEIGIYKEWQTKLNYKAIAYLSRPSEVFNSATTADLISLMLVVAIGVTLFTWLYRRYFLLKGDWKRHWWYALIWLVVWPPVLVITARGGLQQIPINQSESFYSKHNILNVAAVNNAFNLYISLFENKEFLDKNPFEVMPTDAAKRIIDPVFKPSCDSTTQILTTNRPNIVILIMESWSADLIASLGGRPGITPEFNALEKEGLLFKNCYASGSRSEQGMACIFSGFPAHPYTSITVQPDKYKKLPTVTSILDKTGYATSFMFGGQLIYGNIKSYIMYNGFDRITELADFKNRFPEGKLGIHDQYTLSALQENLDKEKQPFFASLFTLSTHSPYDQPMAEKLKWDVNEREYINSAYYTDWCLGEFFRKAKTKSWYKNTLFIIVADHSHNSYKNWDPKSFNYHHIPMLWLGEAIAPEWRGKTYDDICSQTDIAGTLLPQLGLEAKNFHWSRNMFNSCSTPLAYHCTEQVVGWKKTQGEYIWDFTQKKPFSTDATPPLSDSLKDESRAFLQLLFQEYINY